MKHIQEGKVSRNRHFLKLRKLSEYKKFRRAKLFLSLLDDLRSTAAVKGNSIEIIEECDLVQVRLFNPILRYSRKIMLTNAELTWLKAETDLGRIGYFHPNISA